MSNLFLMCFYVVNIPQINLVIVHNSRACSLVCDQPAYEYHKNSELYCNCKGVKIENALERVQIILEEK